MKKKTSLLIRFVMFITTMCMLLSGNTAMGKVSAAATYKSYNGTNINSQDYEIDSTPVYSYLTATSTGYMRVESYKESISGYLVEYYNKNYDFQSSMLIPEELPIFGAFYETEDNYYILSGQLNPQESDSVEVFRITKYDKQWNRIAACGLYGANTEEPFAFGSARMVHSGNNLIIRTCHTMYKRDDGLNHQANVTIQVNMSDMTITDSFTKIFNIDSGYVSHSFNQFVSIEDNHIIGVDHGDAYPRSIVLTKYSSDISQGKFTQNPAKFKPLCNSYNLLKFEGETGENYTGASIGGFVISDTSYIVAGNQGTDIFLYDRNVLVLSMDRKTDAITKNMITNYAVDTHASTPHLVTLAPNRYLLMWNTFKEDNEEDIVINYIELDGNGTPVGQIYSLKGSLSGCVPIVDNGKVIWYTWNDSEMTFYEISTSDLSQTNSVFLDNGKKLPTVDTVFTDNKTGIKYKITKPSGSTGEVECIGYVKKKKAVTIPAKIKYTGISYKVTSIADKAFKGKKFITKISIGKNVENIGKNAFNGCAKLKTVKMGVNINDIQEKAFYKCKSLTSVNIPPYVFTIGKSAFAGCKKLKNITIQTPVLDKKTVGKNAFKGIPSKAVIRVPDFKVSHYKKVLRSRGVSKKAKVLGFIY